MPFPEEIREHLPQTVPETSCPGNGFSGGRSATARGFRRTLISLRIIGTGIPCARCPRARQNPPVVEAEPEHERSENGKDNGPGHHHGAGSVAYPARKPDQPSGSRKFRDIVERPLPAYPAGLFLLVQFGHICSVGHDVVSRAAERHDSKQGDADGEERWQVEREGDQSEERSGDELRQHDEELPCPVEFQHRAPEKLDGPRPHDQ